MVVTWVLFIALAIWDFAGMRMSSLLYQYVDREKFDAARAASDAAKILDWKWFAGWIGANVYFGFLELLPMFGIIARMLQRRRRPVMMPVAPLRSSAAAAQR
jgi:hypothetical protein